MVNATYFTYKAVKLAKGVLFQILTELLQNTYCIF